jgi:hypothetical protein
MRGIRLVTCARDAGMSRSTGRAIRAAVRQGIVRNISILACASEAEDAAGVLVDLGDRADFGLHVCLTSEWTPIRWGPVSRREDVPSLVRTDGTFPMDCAELGSLAPNLDQMTAEVVAQYERLRSLGIRPSYMDEHMAVGDVAGLHTRLEELARKWGLQYTRALLRSGKIRPVVGWTGPGEHPGTELADQLAGLEPATYLLVGHPAFKSQDMERLRLSDAEDVMTQRNRERRMFTDIEIVDYCETSGIGLLRFSEVG